MTRRSTAAPLLAAVAWALVTAPAAAAAPPPTADDAALRIEDQRFAMSVGDEWTARIAVVDPDGALADVPAAPAASKSIDATTVPGSTAAPK